MAGLIEPKISMLTHLDPRSNMGGVATPSDTPTSKLEHFLFWLGLPAGWAGWAEKKEGVENELKLLSSTEDSTHSAQQNGAALDWAVS